VLRDAIEMFVIEQEKRAEQYCQSIIIDIEAGRIGEEKTAPQKLRVANIRQTYFAKTNTPDVSVLYSVPSAQVLTPYSA
jgi:hypothetical protein